MNDRANSRHVKFVDWQVAKNPRKQFGILGINFKMDDGQDLVWWPRWNDVRLLYLPATATEWFNEGPYKWTETSKFVQHAMDVRTAVRSWAREWVEKDGERLKSLIERGFTTQADWILNSDFPRVAEWLNADEGHETGQLQE